MALPNRGAIAGAILCYALLTCVAPPAVATEPGIAPDAGGMEAPAAAQAGSEASPVVEQPAANASENVVLPAENTCAAEMPIMDTGSLQATEAEVVAAPAETTAPLCEEETLLPSADATEMPAPEAIDPSVAEPDGAVAAVEQTPACSEEDVASQPAGAPPSTIESRSSSLLPRRPCSRSSAWASSPARRRP